MEVNRRSEGRFEVVAAEGEVDLYTSPGLRTAVLEAVGSADKGVVVDLAGVPYMDSSGIATLVEGLQAARKSGRSFVLVGMAERVRMILDLARISSLFETAASVSAAVTEQG